ncbi:hypothetical protein ACWN8V_06735 [Vagococcus elongatus]|uniref:Uncharacterized protein n=1 Tax=Vagococcus elongatus TaxID=180344 RepID=A0A430AVZ7_9ENTE|nr:hypothetical protein [Vagococcus elongatus]RSU12230.1 hypothetical protein CBF29_06425 [Vagococcus elongatus]
MKRTRFLVKILINEKLPANDFRQEVLMLDTTFTSTKYHCDCPGLRNQIEKEFWEPYYKRFYTGGRYLMGMQAVIMGVKQDKTRIRLGKRYGNGGFQSTDEGV